MGLAQKKAVLELLAVADGHTTVGLLKALGKEQELNSISEEAKKFTQVIDQAIASRTAQAVNMRINDLRLAQLNLKALPAMEAERFVAKLSQGLGVFSAQEKHAQQELTSGKEFGTDNNTPKFRK